MQNRILIDRRVVGIEEESSRIGIEELVLTEFGRSYDGYAAVVVTQGYFQDACCQFNHGRINICELARDL